MDLIILLTITYVAAGIVYLTREADELVEDRSVSMTVSPMLQILAGLVILLFWPLFLLTECVEVHHHPMAIKLPVNVDEPEPQ